MLNNLNFRFGSQRDDCKFRSWRDWGWEGFRREADWDRASQSTNHSQKPGNSKVSTWPPMENTAFLRSLLVCATIKIILRKKVKKFVKLWRFFFDYKLSFDLLIFSREYERISLASGVKNNSWSQDYKRHSRTKKRRDSNSLRAVPRVR